MLSRAAEVLLIAATEATFAGWRSSLPEARQEAYTIRSEPFDQISSSVEMRADAERLFPIAPWRDIRPGSMLADKCADPVDIIASVSQQH